MGCDLPQEKDNIMKLLASLVILAVSIFAGLTSFAAQFVSPTAVAQFHMFLHSLGL